ncbi:MAG: hypothetical protein LJE95_09775 [Acidobacteria bacterium]|nr:hypothetical protein [Acidobacteriota bacterium]
MSRSCRPTLRVVGAGLLVAAAALQAPATTPVSRFDRSVERVRPDGTPGAKAVTAEAVSLAAGRTLYIPASAHLSGAVGTDWRTDLELHNPGPGLVSVTIALLERDQGNSQPITRTVAVNARESLRFDDVLQTLFSFSGAAALRLTLSAGEVLAASRTYNDQPDGTYGQLVPALKAEEAFGGNEEARLIQLSQSIPDSSGFRTNIGLLNLGASSSYVNIGLYDRHGASLGSLAEYLKPLEFKQLDKVFRRVTTAAVEDGYAVITSMGPFLAYASVIDNRTGDPVFMPAMRPPASGALIIPAAAHLTGAGGTVWRSDVDVHNPGQTQCGYSVELLPRDRDNAAPTGKSFRLDPGASVGYGDILDTMFGFSGAAALRITPDQCSIEVTSRTYNATPAGTYGQLVSARSTLNAVRYGTSVRLIGLKEGTGYRTNVGLVNVGTNPIQVRIDLYNVSGVLLGAVPSQLTSLRSLEFRQLDRVFHQVTSQDVVGGYAVISTDAENGGFFAYASVIDNRTGDPVFMPELSGAGAVTVTKQFEETGYYLRDIEMLNPTVGWAVGQPHWNQNSKHYDTTLLKTNDGGTSWVEKDTGETSGLQSLTFVGTSDGWAVGDNGLVLHTNDGGGTWARQKVPTTDTLRAVAFSNSNTGWVTAIRPVHWDWTGDADNWTAAVWNTADGGATWVEQLLPEGASLLQGIQFIDSKVGWAVGVRYIGDDPWPEHRAVVYHTEDGGQRWTQQYAPDLQISLTDVDFVDAKHGWAVGFLTNSGEEGGATFHTTDGGATWERQDPGGFFDLLWDVQAADANRAYIVGANYVAAWGPPVFRTTDGGTTWEKVIQESHDGEGLYGLALTATGAIGVGDHDYVVRSDDPWGEYGWPNGDNLFTQGYISTHYKLEDVFFADSANGWAVGRKTFAPELWGQVILHTSDGGTTWAEQYEKAPPMDSLFSYFRLDAVTFTDGQNGWAVGSSELYYENGWQARGAIVHTSDGGQHWSEQGDELTDGLAPEFFDVQFLDSHTGWAMDNGHTDQTTGQQSFFFARTTDGGAHWSWVPTGVPGVLAVGFEIVQGGMCFTDPMKGWAVGGLGDIAHTSDGGQTWQAQHHDATYPHMLQVTFTDPNTGWIAAEGGFFSTGDGGQHWTRRDLGLGGDLHDVKFPTSAAGWAVGDGGRILHTVDGGVTWSSVESGAGVSLLGLHCVQSDLCWAVGSHGEILRIGTH